MTEAAEQPAHVPPAPPTSRAQDLLLEFLREHEAPCPVCGYNLKSLTRPFCPECGQALVLSVGTVGLRLRWLLAAVAPGFFSGIAAVFLLVPIVLRIVIGDGRLSVLPGAIDLFGWCSGAFAIILSINRHRFLALPRAAQRWCVAGIWGVHVAALGLFLMIGRRIL